MVTLVRMGRSIEGQFHSRPMGVRFGDTVELDEANARRYVAAKIAEPVRDEKAVERYWRERLARDPVACRQCGSWLHGNEAWAIVRSAGLWKAPAHARCVGTLGTGETITAFDPVAPGTPAPAVVDGWG